ncbi:hypothetical protein AC579_9937 [Pseudocercospora musae]|uniref:Protein kinase domain-containing protein n=1 Tax=Pseudocercospora musae TaxID=113226 RepID=A0A139I0U0_9PEZI|nr:hypothetical protein AC579_9937 [Pseudocercospora musae]KXT08355.1 hypothetical protein AC579_9937 [Pseudocercospora musae]
MECVLLKRLDTSDGAEYLIKMRAFRNFADRHMYRMLLDICDEDNAKEMAKRLLIGNGRVLPEPLFWRILEHLVQAAIVMEQGTLTSEQGTLTSVQDGWQQIVHRDLKADSAFMTSTPRCYYPRALVSDFGMCLSEFESAIVPSADDLWDPKVYRNNVTGANTGAWTCQPYEATPDEDINGENEPRPEGLLILSPANVWCIGITIFQIMNGGEPRLQTKTHYTSASDDHWYSWNPETAVP